MDTDRVSSGGLRAGVLQDWAWTALPEWAEGHVDMHTVRLRRGCGQLLAGLESQRLRRSV